MVSRFKTSGAGSLKAVYGTLFRLAVPGASQVPTRVKLAQHIRAHQNMFSRAVVKTNDHLDYNQEDLSEYSYAKLDKLCVQAEKGEITPKEAHSYEAVHWLATAPESYGARVVGFMANFAACIETDNDQRDREHKIDTGS